MSLEQSMLTLAESNLKLAAAQEHYASVIQQFGSLVVASAGDGATATPAKTEAATPAAKGKGKGKGKAETTPAPETKGDDTGFGDDEGFGNEGGDENETEVPDQLTSDQVKAKLLEVRDAYGDKAPALKIINDLGYSAIPDVKPADFKKVWVACDKAIAAAP